MYLMFVDESGTTALPPNGGWGQAGYTKIFTRVGVVIHGAHWKQWHQRLREFKLAGGLAWSDEIKANDLKTGMGSFAGWEAPRRAKFMADLADLIGASPEIILLGVAIDKRRLEGVYAAVKPEIKSLNLLLRMYERFLHEQQDQNGMVILDAIQEHFDDNLRKYQSYMIEKVLRHSHLVESAFFAKSHTSALLQIADFSTNLFFRREEDCKPSRDYSVLYQRFWRKDGRVAEHGIAHWPPPPSAVSPPPKAPVKKTPPVRAPVKRKPGPPVKAPLKEKPAPTVKVPVKKKPAPPVKAPVKKKPSPPAKSPPKRPQK